MNTITPTVTDFNNRLLLKVQEMFTNVKYYTIIILFFTFLSLALMFSVRADEFSIRVFYFYTLSMLALIAVMTFYEMKYKPMEDKGYRPFVSVIIPAKNEEGSIQKTVAEVYASDYPKDKLEVIVVDDGSTDKTAARIEEIKSDRLVFIKHAVNMGKREAIKSAFKVSKGEIIVTIDSDSFIDKNAIKFLVQPFINKDVVAVAGHGDAHNKDENMLTQLQHYWYQEMFRLMKAMESVLGCVTCCSGILAGYRKSTLEPVIDEWVNEKFLGKPFVIGDDRQLTNYALRGNKQTPTRNTIALYQSNALSYTTVPNTFKQFVKQQLRWKRSWFGETYFACKFMWKKPLKVSSYFYIYQLLSYFSPVIVIYWMVWRPLNGVYDGLIPFVLGTFYIGFILAINVWKHNLREPESIFYRTMFVTISFFTSLVILPWAILTLRNSKWVTRENKVRVR